MATVVSRIHFVNAAYDGIISVHCGVGQCVNNIAKAVTVINQEFLLGSTTQVALHLLTPAYSKSLLAPGEDVLLQSQAICQQTGGNLVFLSIEDNERNQFASIKSWIQLSEQAAQYIEALSSTVETNDRIIVLCHDTAFAGVAECLVRRKRCRKPLFVDWLPHCTGRLYEGDNYDFKRFEWECAAFQFHSSNTVKYRIGFLSEFFRKHISETYHPFQESLFRFYNGILTSDTDDVSEDQVATLLRTFDIPLDQNILFSWGRGSHLKGFDIFLEVGEYLRDNYGYHTVLLMPPAQEDAYFAEHIRAKAQTLSRNCTLILDFNRALPSYLVRHASTRIVGLFSRTDVFPTTSMEARLHSRNAVLIASQASGLAEQVDDGVDGYTVPIGDKNALMSEIDIIMSNENRWAAMVERGRETIRSKYNLEINLAAYLSGLVD